MLLVEVRTQVDRYLHEVAERCANPLEILLPWGQGVARQAKRTARGKGGRRFWREVAASVRVAGAGRHAVSVAAYHVAAAQKQFGGEIRPRPGTRALTIPIADEAQRRRAGEFAGGGRSLFVLPRDQGDTVGILGYSENERFHPLYVLRTRVRQEPDPWWPDARRVSAIGNMTARTWVERTAR